MKRQPHIIPPESATDREARAVQLAERLERGRIFRVRLALGLEALIWLISIGWLIYLCSQVWTAFARRNEFDVRSLFEVALLGLLVFWPIFRVRIVHGYWMRDWDDAPPRH